MKTDYDVIIIGAGPAGASCAKHLVDNGVKSLIIEEKKLPRFKCCAGLYSNRAIKLIEQQFTKIPKNLYSTNDKLIVSFSKRKNRFIPVPMLSFYNMERSLVDNWLINETKAEIIDSCRYISYENKKSSYIIKCKKNQKYYNFSCKYLIGANGARSNLRKAIDISYDLNNSSFAYQVVFKGKNIIEDKYYYVSLNKEFSDYIATIHKKNDLIYICTSASKNNILFNNFINFINFINTTFDCNLKEIRKEGCYSEFYKSRQNLCFGKENILLIGESSGLISIFNEGIPTALITGFEAAKAIINNSNNFVIENYTNNIQKEISYIEKAFKTTKIFFRD